MTKRRLAVGVVFVLLAILAVWLIVGSGGPRGGSVQRVTRPSPALLNAMHEAQKELPGYLNELKSPQPGQRFAVMGRFDSPQGNEYLWIKDPSLKGDKLTGTLDQVPMAAPVHKGDTVSIDKKDVVDWFVQEPDGTDRGKFTEQPGVGG